MAHRFNPNILRAYDIRGVVGETLDIEDARALGLAFGTMVARRGGSSVAVGQDGRASSPALASALCEGLAAAGMDVRRVGLGPTPMLYFAERKLETDAGIMVTGSHNPPDQNGFKMVIGGAAIYGDAIQELAKIAAQDIVSTRTGSISECAVLDNYVERILVDADLERPLTVAWDPGNGAAGPALMRLCESLPGRHVLINENVDGNFPNHHPDPADASTLVQLQETVQAQGCDLGIAFDGDGDRIGVVDATGRILWGDQLVAILARDVLAAQPGAAVIADVKASQSLFDEIDRLGGKPLMWKTGHSLIKAKMQETKAPLAGEMSGHIYLGDRYFGFDDALYAAVRVLNIASRAPQGISSLLAHLPATFSTPEIRVPCSDDRKFAVVEEVRSRLAEEGADVIDIDGVRVRTEDGWWLLRCSNTQAALVVRCEGASAARLRRLCVALAERLCACSVSIAALDGLLKPGLDAAWEVQPARQASAA